MKNDAENSECFTNYTFVKIYESLNPPNQEKSVQNILRWNTRFILNILWLKARRGFERKTPEIDWKMGLNEPGEVEQYHLYRVIVRLRDLNILLIILVGLKMILDWILEKIEISRRKPTVKLKQAKAKGRARY
jgi:hypothetical protein